MHSVCGRNFKEKAMLEAAAEEVQPSDLEPRILCTLIKAMAYEIVTLRAELARTSKTAESAAAQGYDDPHCAGYRSRY